MILYMYAYDTVPLRTKRTSQTRLKRVQNASKTRSKRVQNAFQTQFKRVYNAFKRINPIQKRV